MAIQGSVVVVMGASSAIGHMYLLFCSALRACYYGSSSHRIFPSFLFIRANDMVHLHSKNETVPSPANISEEQICQRID